MSASKITASQTKLHNWQAIYERDQRARKLMEDLGISRIEALTRILDAEEGK